MIRQLFLISIFLFCACLGTPQQKGTQTSSAKSNVPAVYDTSCKTIHVFVALCDNQYQGIVPVPPKIGNGQDPDNNLYWGCGFGIRTYFKKSREWKFLRSQKVDSIRLERLVFKHIEKNYYLVADAYDGKYIKQCTQQFLQSCSGQVKDTIQINNRTVGIYGNSKLISYIGHDGLMDFELTESFASTDNLKKEIASSWPVSAKAISQNI